MVSDFFSPIGAQDSQKESSHTCSTFPTQVFVSGPILAEVKREESLYWLLAIARIYQELKG